MDKCVIFFSYTTEDSDFFQIELLCKYLESLDKSIEVKYWFRNTEPGCTFQEYMQNWIRQCNYFIIFCPTKGKKVPNVAKELGMAQVSNKIIIPVYLTIDDLAQLDLTQTRGLQYSPRDPKKILREICGKLNIDCGNLDLIDKEVQKQYGAFIQEIKTSYSKTQFRELTELRIKTPQEMLKSKTAEKLFILLNELLNIDRIKKQKEHAEKEYCELYHNSILNSTVQ